MCKFSHPIYLPISIVFKSLISSTINNHHNAGCCWFPSGVRTAFMDQYRSSVRRDCDHCPSMLKFLGIFPYTRHAHIITHAGIATSVDIAFSRVCLFVRNLTGKRLELSTPNLVHTYIVVARHALTQRSKGRGHTVTKTVTAHGC